MDTNAKIKKYIYLAAKAKVIAESAIDWRTKNGLIFSEEIGGAFEAMGMWPEWFESDDLEADTKGFISAITEESEKLQALLVALEAVPVPTADGQVGP